jgi:hypothetical protein
MFGGAASNLSAEASLLLSRVPFEPVLSASVWLRDWLVTTLEYFSLVAFIPRIGCRA